MKATRFCVRRPKFTAVVALIVVLLGGISLRRLPVDLMPDISYPTLTIVSSYENASPEEMEELVTRPIEEAMSAVPGVEEVSSESSEGQSRVRVSFVWGTDLDVAANDVRDRLDRVLSRLPEDMNRPSLMKVDPSAMPILILGASGSLDPMALRRLIDEQVKYRLERVPGVAAVDVMGGLEREIRVSLSPNQLKAMAISLDQVLAAIRASNVMQPAGSIEQGASEITLRTPGLYEGLEALKNTVVATAQGVAVRLRDVGTVEDSSQKVTRIVRVDGRPGLQLAVSRQSGKNTVEVARGVRKELEHLQRDFPQIRLTSIIDSSEFIQRSIANVGAAALYGGLFTVLVLLFFLRSWRPTGIVTVAIPVSVVAAFGLIHLAGFTLNLMTLGGLALGIGMLVDSAIVVLENIVRLRDSGRRAVEAAVDGAEEVGSAVLASTLTTVAVFLPLVYVRGMAGELFKQMALVVSFSLLGSLAAALTLVPMLASRYLERRRPSRACPRSWTSRLSQACARGFAALEARYRRLLAWALGHRGIVLMTAGGLFLASLALGRSIGVELLPQTDEGEVRVEVETEVGTRLGQTDEALRRIEAVVLQEVPERKSMVTIVGGGFGPVVGASHIGQLRVALKPQRERARSSEQVAASLRQKLAAIPGVVVRARSGTGLVTRMLLRGLGGGGERIQVEVRGHDLAVADRLAEQVRGAVETVPGVTDVRLSRTPGRPEILMKIDRDRAADLKLTVASVASALKTALGGTVAGYYREGGDEYRILVQMENAERWTPEEILDLILINGAGQPVVLRNVVRPVVHSGPVSIQRLDRERLVTVSANLGQRDLGFVRRAIRARLASLAVPADFTLRLSGESEEQQKTFGELAFGLLLALGLVYMVMVCLYESFRDPLVVMFSVPPAATGVMGMLALTGTTFNVQSFIGCILLGGIVVNNAILLVDQINLLRRRDGMPLGEAIAEAGRRRLRPILMTSMTTVLALVPMALGMGEGGEFQAPLARAVIGGLVSSTLVTLVLVPVVYDLFERPLLRATEPGVPAGQGGSLAGLASPCRGGVPEEHPR